MNKKVIIKESWNEAFSSLLSSEYDNLKVQLVDKNSVTGLPFEFRKLEGEHIFEMYAGTIRGINLVIEDLGVVYAVGVDGEGAGSFRPSGKLTAGLLTAYAGYKGLKSLGEVLGTLGSSTSARPPRLAHAAKKLEDKQYNVFISHSWTYDEHYKRVVDFLEEVPSLDWQNHSVPSTDPLPEEKASALRQSLKDQMRSASLVVVSAGMYSAYSRWIDTEIELARDMGKPIIGIIPEGQEKIPKNIEENCTEICRWRKASLIESISKCT